MGGALFGFLRGGEGFFFFFSLTAPEACKNLIPRPGIEHAPPALEAWTSREVPG